METATFLIIVGVLFISKLCGNALGKRVDVAPDVIPDIAPNAPALQPESIPEDESPFLDIEGNGKWQTDISICPMDDTTIITLYLEADRCITSWINQPSLTIRHQKKKLEIYITWGEYLGERIYVATRIGQNKAVKREWKPSDSGTATFITGIEAVLFLRDLMNADSLAAKVSPHNQNPVTAIFDTSGLVNALQPIKEGADGWLLKVFAEKERRQK